MANEQEKKRAPRNKKKSKARNEIQVSVREMELDDLSEVYHLGEKLFTSEEFPSLYRTWNEWEVTELYNTDPDYCLVADVGDKLAGFILGTVSTKASWTYGYILWLGVRKRFQGAGVAGKLLDRLVDIMVRDGVRFMFLDTDPTNTPAMRFFTRKGFTNPREHVYLSLNLNRHSGYSGKVAAERQRELDETRARTNRRRRSTAPPAEIVVDGKPDGTD